MLKIREQPIGRMFQQNVTEHPESVAKVCLPFDAPARLGEDKTIANPGGVLMADGPCSEAVLTTEHAAIEMFQFAALMLGSESEALRLVENSVASVDIDPCADPSAATGIVRNQVLDGALAIMHRSDPASFADLPESQSGSSCIEDEDPAPLSGEEISELIADVGRSRLRDWLGHLSQAQRAVFVQRAVLGQDNASIAKAINRIAHPSIWTAEAVSQLFRQALCSLATSLVHATPAASV